ncbi:FAD-dependent oxidoreductase [Pseudarthrobacter chlorophenolicus]|uniref:FAD-dependent oxidoreductase n=1 Tax=Pseudarthrobacter chlorophenolicus TaxID=85085 RepID=UPI0005F2D4C7|nr:FAD-dependent monooxygenase [Pseudarthrobacter chlorophenolicus]
MRIIICGAGIGGLTLAHALRGQADVVLLEQDAHAAATAGYRISINHEACGALGRILPTALVEELRSVSDTEQAFRQFTVADQRLRPIAVAPEAEGTDRILAQRQVLRVLLARDLHHLVRFGATVRTVAEDGNGAAVTVADGSVIEGDLVVGADGAGSAVVASLPGQPPARDLGLTGIAGWSPLGSRFGSPGAPTYLGAGPALAFGPDGTGVFLSLYGPPSRPVSSAHTATVPSGPALIWGTIARSDRLADTRNAPPEVFIQQALGLLGRWSPWLEQHVAASDPALTEAFRFRAADPSGPLAGWTPGRVTALGDAVHAMPPTGGRGASTAICDAADLAAALRRHLGGRPLSAELAAYQRTIVPRARSAIRESLGPVRIINTLRHRPLQLLARPLLGAAGALGARRYGQRQWQV